MSKPVRILGIAGSLRRQSYNRGALGTARAQYHLRQVTVFLDMFPVNQPEVMIANASQRFDAEGNLTDEVTREYVGRLLQGLVDWTQRVGREGGR